MTYREKLPFQDRLKEAKHMLERYPERIPIIVEPKETQIQVIDKKKYMAPQSLTVGQFIFVIRKRLKIQSSDALFIFCNNKLVNSSQSMMHLYENEKADDGFLYMNYAFENTFGS